MFELREFQTSGGGPIEVIVTRGLKNQVREFYS